MTRPLFFFSAGEPSGDIHAAQLILELRRRFPRAEFTGYGGPEMEKAGCRVLVLMTELAVMWLGRVLWHLPTFLRHIRRAGAFFREHRPDAVILVDYPGFNWQIAKQAKKAGIPVYYYMPPQIWGWAQHRVKKMKRLTDHVLCCFPFEQKWLAEHGCHAYLTGHPFFEEVRKRTLDDSFMTDFRRNIQQDNKLLLLLPGSRNQEVAMNTRDMLHAAGRVVAQTPTVLPVIAAFKESHAERVRQEMRRQGLDFPVFVGRTPELMAMASAALAVSGSVSVELLARTCPTVIYYRVGKFPLLLSRFFRCVKYITLTNLLAVDRVQGESLFFKRGLIAPAQLTDRERSLTLFPEYLTAVDASLPVANTLVIWLTDETASAACRCALRDLLQSADAQGDPVVNTADYIMRTLEESPREQWRTQSETGTHCASTTDSP
ncbi:MAG: lipid-A-disaccharide synthase [Planctomycetia bacterium]|nr:lipid-A-disaccharide synthase [Planctomycetia bacterium]